MKILIIGATGQIGLALSHGLAKTSHSISALVRRKNPLLPSNIETFEFPEFTATVLQKSLQGIDLVIYGLGIPEQWLADPSTFDRINLGLFECFLKELIASRVKKLVYISTYEVFSENKKVIRESHSVHQGSISRYFDAMIRAFQMAKEYEKRFHIEMVTIHPAAVYGGRNTGGGATDLIVNAKNRNFLKLPALIHSSFPVVHVDALIKGILLAIEKEKWGESYIFSDEMTSLEQIVRTVKSIYPKTFVPLKIPIWIARVSAFFLELLSNFITRRPPIMAKVQIDFITKGLRPSSEKAQRELDWKPMPLSEGIKRMFSKSVA